MKKWFKNYLDSIIPIAIVCLTIIIMQFTILIAVEFHTHGIVLNVFDDKNVDRSILGIFSSSYFAMFVLLILLFSLLTRFFTTNFAGFTVMAALLSLGCQYELFLLPAGNSSDMGSIQFWIILPLSFVLIAIFTFNIRIFFANHSKTAKFYYMLIVIMFADIIALFIFSIIADYNHQNLYDSSVTIGKIFIMIAISLIPIIIAFFVAIMIIAWYYTGNKFRLNDTNMKIPQDLERMWFGITKNRDSSIKEFESFFDKFTKK